MFEQQKTPNQERMRELASSIAAELNRLVLEDIPIEAIQFGIDIGKDDIRVMGGGRITSIEHILKGLALSLEKMEMAND